MSTYNYSPEEFQAEQSAQQARRKAEQLEFERLLQIEKHRKAQEDAIIQESIQRTKGKTQHSFVSELRNDRLGKEAYDMLMHGRLLFSVPLAVASSTAIVASQTKATLEAQEYLANGIHREIERKIEQSSGAYKETLNEYANRVAIQQSSVQTTQSTYFTNYVETKKDALHQIESAKAQYEDHITKIEQNIAKADQAYKKAIAETSDAKDITNITKQHTDAIQKYIEQKTAVDNNYKDIVAKQTERINNAKETYKSEVKAAKKELTIAEGRALDYQLNGALAEQIKANTEILQYRQIMRNPVTGTGENAANFVMQISRQNHELSLEIGTVIGTTEEKSLIAKYKADELARKNAEQTGMPYVSLITKEEHDQIKSISEKYAGTLTSEKNIRHSIQLIENAQNAIQSSMNVDISRLNKLTSDVTLIATKLSKEEKALDEINQHKKALRTGLRNGVKLTQEERESIASKLQKLGSADHRISNIKNLKKELTVKKEKLDAQKTKLETIINSKKSLINQLTIQHDVLSKYGKKLAQIEVKDNQWRGKRKGQNKKAEDKKSKAYRKRQQSINYFQNKLKKGYVIDKEVDNITGTLAKWGDNYLKAVAVMQIGSKMLMYPAKQAGNMAIRVIGQHTTVGKKLTEKWKNYIQTDKGKKFLERLSHTKSISGKIIKAPAAVLRAPKDLPRNVRRAAMNKVRYHSQQVVGRGIGTVGFHTKSFFKRTRMGQAITRQKEKIKYLVTRSVPGKIFKKLKNNIFSIITSIMGLISSIVSTIVAAVSMLLGSLFMLLIMFVLIIIVFAMFVSVIAAVGNFFESLTAKSQALVKNDPAFIMEQAVNYRNAELEILDLFYNAGNGTTIIEPNDSPIYYKLYDDSFHWFGSNGSQKLESQNGGALSLYNQGFGYTLNNTFKYENISYPLSSVGNILKSSVDKYDSVKLNYYNGDDVVESNGTYTLKANATKSQYEISNAKDALAIVDSLYSQKSDDMQKYEVLAYLGVGDYQMGVIGDSSTTVSNNLFWATHKIIYLSGNKNSDIWYHTTELSSNSDTQKEYSVNPRYKYKQLSNGQYTREYVGDGSCDNQEVMEFTYTYTVSEYETIHKTWGDFSFPSAYGDYYLGNGISASSTYTTNKTLTASQWYFYYNRQYNSLSPTTNISVSTNTGTVRKYLAKLGVNKSSNWAITQYHKDSSCNRLNFYRYSGNTYYIVNKAGQYMGTITISKYSNSAIYNMITKAKINGKDYSINNNNGTINLDYFFLTWNGNAYEFPIIATSQVTSSTATSVVNQRLNNPLYVLGQGYTYYKPTLNTSKCVISCDHLREVEEERTGTIYYHVCKGHLDLDVALAVTSLEEDGGLIFDEAANVAGNETDTSSDSFLGIFTFPDSAGVSGFGSVTVKAYHPYEDWAEDSALRSLAEAKAKMDFKYNVGDDSQDYIFAPQIKHRDGTGSYTFPAFAINEENQLLYGFSFGDATYYTTGFVSGEQKGMTVYQKNQENQLTAPSLISFAISRTGVPHVTS